MLRCLVISGPPCAGKSTLARALAARYGWPLLAKDDYKERIFGHLGAHDREFSRRVSRLAWDLLLTEAGRLLGGGVACLVEGNLRAAQAARLREIGARAGATLVEIRCRAAPVVLLARYRARAASGTRHAGHVDLEALPEIERELAVGEGPWPEVGAQVLIHDTTAGFDERALLAALDAALGRT